MLMESASVCYGTPSIEILIEGGRSVLLLLLTLAADALWIAFDVWGYVVTTPTLPPTEWYLFVGSGAALITITLIAGILQFWKDREEKKLRNRYEWSLPTSRQRADCISSIGRTGQEEFGERRVRFFREPSKDCIKITDELGLIFREAGFEISDVDVHAADTIIRPGVWIEAPEGHPSIEPIIRGLTAVFGEFNVHHHPVSSPLPAYFNRAMVISIRIGRKPIQHIS
jgi:hypothetical protein